MCSDGAELTFFVKNSTGDDDVSVDITDGRCYRNRLIREGIFTT